MSNRKLIELTSTLLDLDEQRALVPRGVGGYGREILEQSAIALADRDALAAQRDEGLAREAELERENRLLRHDCASFLETMAKTCDLLGIDPESAQNAQGKPSDVLYEHVKDLQQRLDEATDLLKHMTCSYHRALENGYDRIIFLGGDCDSVDKMENEDPFYAKARAFLASPGGACIETSLASAVHLPRRKVKTEYSTAKKDTQADAWNEALDAVQELNR